MNKIEKRATFSLALIFALRMLGLFMILPIFAMYARDFSGSTATLIGVALGIYGLTQALLQMPFGMLSDRYGRKPVITCGLLLFALGSLIAALSDHISGLIIGRAIQGAGAIGSTTIALMSDLTRDNQRARAMAFIGMMIGLSFGVGIVISPVLGRFIQLSGIFWLTAGLALLGIWILYWITPDAPSVTKHQPLQLKALLSNWELQTFNLGIFSQHAILTAHFMVIPLLLQEDAGIPPDQQWLVYLSVLLVTFGIMLALIRKAEKTARLRPLFLLSIAAIIVSELLLSGGHYFQLTWLIYVSLLVYFTGFNVLEACLPTFISKKAPPSSKGSALGLYSTLQFLGIFFGGFAGGWLFQHYGMFGVFSFCLALSVGWLTVAMGKHRFSEAPASSL